MKKIYYPCIVLALMAGIFFTYKKTNHNNTDLSTKVAVEEEDEGYDGPAERDALEFEKMKDPALGAVPGERLWNALAYTNALKAANDFENISILWTERGPVYDSVGPSNGNGRGGGGGVTGGYTSGRMAAILVDTLNDPSGNTVFCGGINGGLWRCTNFLSSVANWQLLDDYFDNMAISSICQDPTKPNVMYFATGEPTANADAVNGKGIWKSIDKGLTWVQLLGTTNFIRSFKILCDKDGNVYLAARVTTTPVAQPAGLLRSKNGGITWTDITPNNLTSNNATCTDVEYSSTGWLHASFGYSTGATGGKVSYRLTNHPADASTSAGWNTIEIRPSNSVANRLELAAIADTLYAVTTNGSNNVDSIYKSINGGASWTIEDTSAVPTGVANGQGWYNLTLAINPDSTNQIIIGGLDAYRSVNSGTTLSRLTYWVSTQPYVHADHHYMQWSKIADESRIIIGCDGGIFLSRDSGRTWKDKNRNLSIKQFYGAAIHPTDPYYLLAGAQDNGTHQLKNPGLSYSTEVTGGDGCFVHINQKNPNIQFGSYVYNQYRRSINGGVSWSSFNLSGNIGMFVNPYEYDDDKNIMYCSWGTNALLRWNNPATANATAAASRDTIAFNSLKRTVGTSTVNGAVSAFKVSAYTPGRVFIGGNNGKLVMLDNADTVKTTADSSFNVKDITGTTFPNGFLNCVNTGTTDNNLVAVFTNYGINNVWYSGDGGTTWSAIDGNLPDMPVRWAVFQPGTNDKMILATEAGVYVTQQINGASTQWMPSPGFPTVRTDQIQIRSSDYAMVAATHGRGLFTSNSFAVLPLHNLKLSGVLSDENKADLNWFESGATGPVKYTVQFSTDGVAFKRIDDLSATKYVHDMNASVGFYRIMAVEKGQAPVFSNIVMLKSYRLVKGLQLHLAPNPVRSTASLLISGATGNSNYNWHIADIQGRILQNGSGAIRENQTLTQSLDVSQLSSGLYLIRVVQNKQAATVSFIKQ